MARVQTGDRIRLTQDMDDPDGLPAGATGTVRRVLGRGELAQIDVAWDRPYQSRILMVLPGVDRFEKI